MTSRWFSLLAALLLLAACMPAATPVADAPPAADPSTSVSSGPIAPANPANPAHPPPGTSALRCDAARAQSAIGKVATQDVVDQAVADSTSGAVRVIKPGDAVTDDFSEGRLNLEVDSGNTITRASCG